LDLSANFAKLIVMSYQLKNLIDGTAYPLTGLIKQVGRSPECDIVLPDEKVSRLHARLDKTEQGWVLVDLESTNGTMVNGKRITEKLLEPGDEIQFGSFSFRYEERKEPEISDEATRVEEKPERTPGLFGKFSFWKKKK